MGTSKGNASTFHLRLTVRETSREKGSYMHPEFMKPKSKIPTRNIRSSKSQVKNGLKILYTIGTFFQTNYYQRAL